MARMRIVLAAGLWALAALSALSPQPLRAAPVEGVTRIFAICAGRFSAQLEQDWLFSDPGSDATERQRDQMIDLLDAVSPADAQDRVLMLRLQAKRAHARLLSQAVFSLDGPIAARAARQADKLLRQCSALMPARPAPGQG